MKRSRWAVLGLTALAFAAASAFAVAGAFGNPTEPGEPEPTHEFTCLEADHETTVHCAGHGEEATTKREFGPEGEKEHLTEHVFTNAIADLKCETTTFDVTTSDGTSVNAPTVPTYSGCAAGAFTAHIAPGDCHYEFYVEGTQNTPVESEDYEETEGVGSSSVVCDESSGITIEITRLFGGTKCHIEVHPQDTITPIYFRNKTEGLTDVTVEAADATVIADYEGGFFNCGVTDGEHHTEYHGNTTVVAEDTEGEPLDSRFDDGKEHTEE